MVNLDWIVVIDILLYSVLFAKGDLSSRLFLFLAQFLYFFMICLSFIVDLWLHSDEVYLSQLVWEVNL